MSDLCKLLPLYERSSNVFNELINSEGIEFDLLESKIEDLENQFSINTATWGLDFFEKQLNILTDLNKTYEERRSIIISKWRGSGKIDKELIKIVVDSYNIGEVEVTFDGNIIITVTGSKGKPEKFDDINNSVEEIKPAHLMIQYLFSYYLVSEMNQMTITEINQIPIKELAF